MSNPIVLAGHWRPGKRRSLQAHLNAGLELVLVTGGRTRWQINGRIEQVPPGSVFYTLPWEQHGGVDELEPGLELYFAVVQLDRPYRRAARNWRFHAGMMVNPSDRRWIVHTLGASARRAVPSSAELGQWLRQIVHGYGGNAGGNDSQLAGLATAAVVELARCVAAAESRPGVAPSSVAQRIDTLLADLADRCDERWTLQRMADHCGLARTRFAEILKQQTGDTPTMALNRIRVQRAVQALRDTDLPITQIALDCGFCSSQYFARVFREYRGVSAGTFRRRRAS
jgi:AraC family L-rhamnose operon regulatory protein RhaS